MIASKLGLWRSALSLPEMADLMEQVAQLFAAANTPKAQRDKMLAPLYDRIEPDHWSAAQGIIRNRFNALLAFGREIRFPLSGSLTI